MNYSIDSFIVRIPLSKVKIADSELNQSILRISKETGECLNEERITRKYVETGKGVKVTIQVKTIRDKVRGRYKYSTYLVIKCTSKLLKERYFEGINHSTIYKYWEALQALNVAHFSFDVFMRASITDLDIKRDFRLEPTEYKALIESLKVLAKPSIYQAQGIKFFNQKGNTGIQFSARETATPANPYLKIYNKKTELEVRSTEFRNTYLRDVDLENLYRFEFTLKNAKHMKMYEIEPNNLANFMHLFIFDEEQGRIQRMAKDIWNKHVNPIQPTVSTEKESSLKRVYLKTIPLLLAQNYPKSWIVEHFTNDMDRAGRSRHKKIIEECFSEVEGKNPSLKDRKIDQILERIGVA